jgi:hypothetical protein
MRRIAVLRSVNRATGSTPGKRFQISDTRFISDAPISSCNSARLRTYRPDIYRPWFVTRRMWPSLRDEKASFESSFRYSVAAVRSHPSLRCSRKASRNVGPKNASDCVDSLLQRLDFGASHQPTMWHVQATQSRPITAAKLQSKEQLRTATIPTISTRTLTRMAVARCSRLPAAKKRK